MTYKVLAMVGETDTFEGALQLAGAMPQPEFKDCPGELFVIPPEQIAKNCSLAVFVQHGAYILQTPDAADELTDAEAQDLAEDSLKLAEMFMNEMDGANPFPRHDPPGLG
jgi:hypothetical protein